MGLMRIPYTAPLPAPTILPSSAGNISGAVAALHEFLTPRLASPKSTLLLTGAGISVASGLADYRGTKGTYTLNKTYRPIYFHEFAASHEARKRYWARSFLGWPNLHKSSPNAAHRAVAELGDMGYLSSVITQNVDSFHPAAHPSLQTLELHGYLRSAVCLSCRTEYDRSRFQSDLATLNPAWSAFLSEMLESGALSTENPDERRRLGLKTNPDGDVDIPGIQYGTFRYPACPTCLAHPPTDADGVTQVVKVDDDGGWIPPSPPSKQSPSPPSSAPGVLKPAVIMFGESIPSTVKTAAESAVDACERVVVLGSSLATYSAWRLIKQARESGKPIAIANLGGVRGEELFFENLPPGNTGAWGVRCSHSLEELLPALVTRLKQDKNASSSAAVPLSEHILNFKPAAWAYK